MYQALYRKYRPQTFADVYGQEHITQTLCNQLSSGRIFHAYLFTGSRGTGKTTCAKILAKAACCPDLIDGAPCGVCEVCRGIDDGSLTDVLEIDAASNNGVDDIRTLREGAVYTPTVAKYRVYIIDEVHMLSQGAFNALLKTLEEPPAHVIFILATTEVHKLPATILSRCQRFDFRRISPELIAKRLKYVCEKEGMRITDDAATLIASLADGGMRDALSILDLCAGKAEVTEEAVSEITGMAGKAHLFTLTDRLGEKNISAVLELIGQLHTASVDMLRLCGELISHFRNIMLVKTLKNPVGTVVCSSSEMEQLRAQADNWRLDQVIHALEIFGEAQSKMARGNRRTLMEMAAVRLCTPELDSSRDAILSRLTALERAIKTGAAGAAGTIVTFPAYPTAEPAPKPVAPPTTPKAEPAQAAHAPVPDAQRPPWEDALVPPVVTTQEVVTFPAYPTSEPAPEPIAPPEADTPTLPNAADVPLPEGSFAGWTEVLGILAKTCPLLHGFLYGSSAYIDGNMLLIDCDNSQFRELLGGENPMYKNALRAAAQEVTGQRFRLGPYKRKTKQAEADPFAELIRKAEKLGL